MSNLQLNKLKSRIKNGTEVTLKLSSHVVGDSNNENNFSYKLLLTKRQVLRLFKTFSNGFSANIKLSKSQLYKIEQSRGFLDRLNGLSTFSLKANQFLVMVLKPLLKTDLLFMKMYLNH